MSSSKKRTPETSDQLIAKGTALCDALAGFMSEFCDTQEKITCCLKVIVGEKGNERVVSLARSQPRDGFHSILGRSDLNFVSENTTWAALLGRAVGKGDHNGTYKWQQYNCFVCNDLRRQDEFFSDVDWHDWYNSILIFTLRYVDDFDLSSQNVFGFIQFDSKETNAFSGMPNIFEAEFTDNQADGRKKYVNQLHSSAIFHLGAVVADSLSMFLRPFYEAEKATAQERSESNPGAAQKSTPAR